MMKEKLNEVYKRLQTLNLPPTQGNLETMLQCLYDLKSIYNELEAKEAGADGQTADHE